ncbi:squalene/phytoene synthase family protein [Rhodobacter maris]|uniref:Phytoene/squalene synthetase n=1 Tax=Rhodobacter maris TaxID=446682 RepID=A0A285RW55_9RHOB|nr:squalene/phytoene synthase family protein [Rhodobacter maris]SOB98748.1 phytoene/squalene synthetase [Rhodobacter maris]
MSDPVTVCAERLAAGDPDRFAAVMALPGRARAPLFAVYAANLELARAPWAAREPMVAEIRLQWWIDALGALAAAGTEPRHEIGPALLNIAPEALELLVEMGEVRRTDCWSDPFEDAGRLRDYLDATSGALTLAAARALGLSGHEAALRAAGAAAGLAAWLVALPELTARGRLCLAGARPEDLAGLASEALVALDAAEVGLKTAPEAARFATLAHWQARRILHHAAKAPERIAAGELRGSEFRRRLSLLQARARL